MTEMMWFVLRKKSTFSSEVGT